MLVGTCHSLSAYFLVHPCRLHSTIRKHVLRTPIHMFFSCLQIMKAASSQRRDAKPVLKSGGKWPAITLHTPPILQPNCSFEGADACRHLQMHLVEAAASFLPHTAPDDGSQLENASPEGTPADESGDGEPDGEQEPPRAASGHVVSNDQHHSHCNDAEHSGVRQCSGVVAVSIVGVPSCCGLTCMHRVCDADRSNQS